MSFLKYQLVYSNCNCMLYSEAVMDSVLCKVFHTVYIAGQQQHVSGSVQIAKAKMAWEALSSGY